MVYLMTATADEDTYVQASSLFWRLITLQATDTATQTSWIVFHISLVMMISLISVRTPA